MGPQPPELLLIGREPVLARLRANAAAGRHTLLAGPIGIGKTRLLRAVADACPEAVWIEAFRPLRQGLLALGQALHARGVLQLPGPTSGAPGAGTLDAAECARRLGKLTVPALTDVVADSLRDQGLVLMLDQLEGLTPVMGRALERLLAEATVLGATRELKAGLEKVWWAFERLEVPPLGREATVALFWALVDRTRIADPAALEARIVAATAGNPHAIVELARQVAETPDLPPEAFQGLAHGAGERYLDLTPGLLLIGAGLVMARFVALGLDDRDLYILAGSLGAFLFVVRYLLARTDRGR